MITHTLPEKAQSEGDRVRSVTPKTTNAISLMPQPPKGRNAVFKIATHYAHAKTTLANPDPVSGLTLSYPGALYDAQILSWTLNVHRIPLHTEQFPVVIAEDDVSITAALRFLQLANGTACPVHLVGVTPAIAASLNNADLRPWMRVAPAGTYSQLSPRARTVSTRFSNGQMRPFDVPDTLIPVLQAGLAHHFLQWVPGGATLSLPYLAQTLSGDERQLAADGQLDLDHGAKVHKDLQRLATHRAQIMKSKPPYIFADGRPVRISTRSVSSTGEPAASLNHWTTEPDDALNAYGVWTPAAK